MSEEISIADFNTICRICLNFFKKLIPISVTPIQQKLSACTSIQVSHTDEMPKHVCHTCLNHLNTAFTFKYLSEESDKYLKEIIKKEKIQSQPLFESKKMSLQSSRTLVTTHNYIQFEKMNKSVIHVENLELNNKENESRILETNSLVTDQLNLNENDENVLLLTCPQCNKKFDKQSVLSQHLAVHTNERPHECEICNKRFKQLNAVQNHVNLVHSGTNRVVCKICNKSLIKSQIKRHMKIHDQSESRKKINCQYCHLPFLMISLKQHILRKHKEIIDADYSCNICGKKCYFEAGLNQHMNSHKLHPCYNCKVCGKQFKIERFLAKHKRQVHSFRKPCIVCGKMILEYGMQIHLKVHSNKSSDKFANCNNNNEIKHGKLVKTKEHLEEKDELFEELNNREQVLYNEEIDTEKLEELLDTKTSEENIPVASHYRNLPTKSNQKPCQICGKYLYKKSMSRHMQTHERSENREKIECEYCHQLFYLNSVKEHVLRKHKDQVSNNLYACKVCGRHCYFQAGLDKHIVKHKLALHKCGKCNAQFKFLFNLNRHQKRVHLRVQCKICEKTIFATCLQQHMKIHDINRKRNALKCNQCPKQFLHNISLKQHILKIHENQPPVIKYLCNICGVGRRTKNDLEEHLLTHSNTKSYECKKCDAKFKSPSGLRNHFKSIHLNIKSYECSICFRRFLLKTYLTAHMLTHTGEKPFVCIICDKPFRQNSALRNHVKITHWMMYKDKRELLKCDHCDKKYLHASTLRKHILREHENKDKEMNYLCYFCGKRFNAKSNLRQHVAIHQSERPYKCEKCEKSFKIHTHLARHMKKIHTDPYLNKHVLCKFCEKMFANNSNLEQHIITIHSSEVHCSLKSKTEKLTT